MSNQEPVAWYDPTNKNPGQSVTFKKEDHERWPHIYSVPLVPLVAQTKAKSGVVITPDEALHEKHNVIPEAVLNVVNQLLRERWDNHTARITQAEVFKEAFAIMRADGANVTKDDFFKRHWLDFEQVYKNAGWKVEYDRPGYNESYEAFWVFSKP
jgi:hypothetical protein